MHKSKIALLFKRDLQKLHDEVGQYTSEEQLWKVIPETINSGGVLAQHLVGNLRTYIGLTLGDIPYVRNRDAEFSEKRFDREGLLVEISDLIQIIPQVVSELPENRLAEPYPHEVFSLYPDQDVATILTHLLMHLAYHNGQLNYHRRISAAD